MPNVAFKIGANTFNIDCEKGQEPQIEALSRRVNEKIKLLSNDLKSAPNNLLMAIALLMQEDEISNLKSGNFIEESNKIDKYELENLKEKFESEKSELLKQHDLELENIKVSIEKKYNLELEQAAQKYLNLQNDYISVLKPTNEKIDSIAKELEKM